MSDYLNINRNFVEKGWGYEDWIVNKEKYCGKILFLKKDHMCSWHYHKIKDETFYLQEGKLKVLYGYDEDIEKSESIVLEKGDSFHIPVGMIHRMIAIEDSYLFEFSTQHFDSDSYRIKKGN